ncbi:hypothetical protein FB459_2673 [Yimella lutea]|uniref:Uncharacterized protein n=1 Tax=Yimella lutea TaxID=587872 RepID=A0A542EIM7_9MICO|nr:hypothetical protein FB459_2673 [Yimella lutea]
MAVYLEAEAGSRDVRPIRVREIVATFALQPRIEMAR